MLVSCVYVHEQEQFLQKSVTQNEIEFWVGILEDNC